MIRLYDEPDLQTTLSLTLLIGDINSKTMIKIFRLYKIVCLVSYLISVFRKALKATNFVTAGPSIVLRVTFIQEPGTLYA